MRSRLTAAFALAVVALAIPASAQTSWGIGVLQNGAIFFCDPSRATVWRVDPDGRRTAAMTGVTCRAITTSADGMIYGESTPSEVEATRGVGVWRLDASGTRQWLMPPTLSPMPGISLVHDAQGQQFSWSGAGTGSARSEILLRSVSGATAVAAGGVWGQNDGDGRDAALGNVAGMAIAPDGSLVIADSGNIRRLSPLLSLRSEAKGVVTDSHLGLVGAPGLWGRELGVATDTSGAAVIVDPEAGHIVHVDRHGRATPIWEPAGFPQRISGGRWGWRPAGVAMMGRSYYVLDEWMGPALIADLVGSPRLSQVDAAGRVTRIVSVSSLTVRAAALALLVVVLSALWSNFRRGRVRV